jgi:two-component system, sensor histidine kinase and response regulator
MNRPNFIISSRTLSAHTFEAVRKLSIQMIPGDRRSSSIFSEKDLADEDRSNFHFLVVLSKQFNILLIGEVSPEFVDNYNVSLTFDNRQIAIFLEQIKLTSKQLSTSLKLLKERVNNPIVVSEFTLSLLEMLDTESRKSQHTDTEYPSVSVCQPVEEALSKQVEKERLLNQVTAQTHQQLQLPEILQTSVKQVRDFLQVDRLLIYQLPLRDFHSNLSRLDRSFIYESRSSDRIPSLLNESTLSNLIALSDYLDLYSQGFSLAIDDITTVGQTFSPSVQMWQQASVRSQLVVPILLRGQLWGVLISHACFHPHSWRQHEKDFLKHIAEHLSVAIDQAYLYEQVQQQKQTLEQQISEQTQALRDALISAQAANKFKSEFLSTMSHELRTPLTCVIGMSSTLLRWSFGQLSDQQRRYIQTIYSSGEHLLELIDNILDFSELEAGKAILNVSEFSLTQLAHQSVQMLSDKAAAEGVELKLDLSLESGHDRFRADVGRVRHILFNLLSNAIKFTPEKGEVTLHVCTEKNRAVFEIEDTGIGIPKEQIPQLFQIFKQLDGTYTRQYNGMGLGLALTKQLVDLHGGNIEVESTPNRGSKFTVTIPIQPFARSTAPSNKLYQQTDYPRVFPHGTVILIADREEDATLICDLLTAAGYQVVWIVEGSTALTQVQILQPIAVIIDQHLESIDGLEIISTLRAHPTTQSLKIILLTQLTSLEEQENCHISGADECLLKPLQPQQLLNKLLEVVSDAVLRERDRSNTN